MASPSIASGQLTPWSTWGKFNEIAFAIRQALSAVQTATLVQIVSCTNDGDLSPVGTVDILPLVNQVDGNGNPVPHVTIYNVPYLRMQGGSNAVIMDPVVGDIGLAVFGSRDLSKVVSTKAQANPGSFRIFDFSDALYVGGALNAVPQQYIQFQESGISIVSPGTITLTAPNIVLDGAVAQSEGNATIQGTLTVMGDVVAGTGAISLGTHTHTSEDPGTPTSPPL